MEAANQFQIFHHSIVNAMQLTNFSFLNSRMDYLDSQANFKSAVQRISSGSKMEGLRKDVGAYSQGVNARMSKLFNNSFKINLQNTRSYIDAQEQGLREVLDIYNRMDEIAIKAMDPTSNAQDRNLYNIEFHDLTTQLNEIMTREFNGEKLFNDTLVCGGAKDIPLGELDLVNSSTRGVHAVRAQSIDVNAPAGTVSFRVNSGGAGDIYRVWMGDVCVFSAGGAFEGPTGSHTQQHDDPGGFNFPSGDHWMTSGSANNGDDDLIEVTFGPGQPTTYKITPGASNDPNNDGISNFNSYDTSTGLYNVILTNDLSAEFEDTTMTLQIETRTIGIIYAEGDSANNDADGSGTAGVKFVPENYEKPVMVNSDGDYFYLDPKGFGTLDGKSPVTGTTHTLSDFTSASDTFDHLRGNKYQNDPTLSYYGEEKCIVNERLASVAAEKGRIDKMLEDLERKAITDELTISRIEDADVAQEATNLATASIKTQMSAQVMSKSTRLKDVLIALTTEHYRGSVLSSKL